MQCCLCVLLSLIFVVAGCKPLFGTGTAIVMLLAIRDTSCRVVLLLSIGSLLKTVFIFSIFAFCCVVLLSTLAIDIV